MAFPPSHDAALPNVAMSNPLREAFLKRSLETVSHLAAVADLQLLGLALAAATGAGALARVLAETAAIGASTVDLDPLTPLVARNAEHRLETLSLAGGVLSSTEAAAELGITRQAVEKRRRAHALLAVRIGGDWRYPRCQFDEATGETVAGLPKLLGALRKSSPWVVLEFLLAPDETLGGETPLETLRRCGMTEALNRLARIEQGDGFA